MAWPATAEELPGGVENQTDAETGEPNPVDYAKAGGEDPEGEGDHAARHNDLADAVNRTWGELGVNPSGSQADVAARLDAIGLTLATHTEGLSTAAAAIAAEATRAEAAEASKAALVHTHSQYDPFDQLPGVFPSGLYPGTSGVLTAKRVYLIRFTVARERAMRFVRAIITTAGSAEDKVDAGVYVVSGGKLELMASSGAVKRTTNSLGVKAMEMTANAACKPGSVYYAAMVQEAISGTPNWAQPLSNNGNYGDVFGTALGNRLMVFRNGSEVSTLPASIESAILEKTLSPWMVPSES
jgi:hypothetical protein